VAFQVTTLCNAVSSSHSAHLGTLSENSRNRKRFEHHFKRCRKQKNNKKALLSC